MAKIQNFVLGIQARDKNIGGGYDVGPEQYTGQFINGNSTTRWATDSDSHDPDEFRIGIFKKHGEVNNVNLRFTGGIADNGKQEDSLVTPYVDSMKDGQPYVMELRDRDSHDPDGVAFGFQGKTSSSNQPIDIKVGIQILDNNGTSWSELETSPWLVREGGWWSRWTKIGQHGYDPDVIRIVIYVQKIKSLG